MKEHKYRGKMALKSVATALQLAALALLLLPLGSSALRPAASQQQAPEAGKFELKFIQDLDNATIIKRPAQQQVLKCQVKFSQAPARNSISANAHLAPLFFRPSMARFDKLSKVNANLLANVSICIEWLRNDAPLLAQYPSDAVLTLAADSDGLAEVSRAGGKAAARKLEIRTTVNEAQLKFTSRLKISQLDARDSGQFKCLARASFSQPPPARQDAGLSAEAGAPAGRPASRPALVEQFAESSIATLVVSSGEEAASIFGGTFSKFDHLQSARAPTHRCNFRRAASGHTRRRARVAYTRRK